MDNDVSFAGFIVECISCSRWVSAAVWFFVSTQMQVHSSSSFRLMTLYFKVFNPVECDPFS